MAKIIAASYTPLDNIEMRTRNPIRASNWREIAEVQNYSYSKHGSLLAGVHLENETTGEPFTLSAGASYTALSNNSIRLDEFTPQCRFLRPLKGGGYLATIKAYGYNFDLEVKAKRGYPTTGDTITSNAVATLGWAEVNIELPEDFIDPYSSGEVRPVAFQFRVKRVGSAELRLHAINIYEGAITPAQLP